MKELGHRSLAIGFCLMLALAVLRGGEITKLRLYDFPGGCACSCVNPGIATGSHSGVYIRIGEDIAKLCGTQGFTKAESPECYCRDPRFRLNVIATQGGFDGIKRLQNEGEVQLAIVQSDLHYFAKQQSQEPMIPDAQRKLWKELATDIRLLLPLYTEAIHVVVRPDDRFGEPVDPKNPKGEKKAPRYQTFRDLFDGKARVNIGTKGSGTMITSLLLESLVLSNGDRRNSRTWKPFHYGSDVALKKLLVSEELDAVILVGAQPFPALERYGQRVMQETIKKQRRFMGMPAGQEITTDVFLQPQVAFLPVEIGVDPSMGYVKTNLNHVIRHSNPKTTVYETLTGNDEPVPTLGITSCLVTHRTYRPKENGHKIAWVVHVLNRILSNLDKYHGLDRDVIDPVAGTEIWREVCQNLGYMVTNPSSPQSWRSFGWELHEDPIILKLLGYWEDLAKNSLVIDPNSIGGP